MSEPTIIAIELTSEDCITVRDKWTALVIAATGALVLLLGIFWDCLSASPSAGRSAYSKGTFPTVISGS